MVSFALVIIVVVIVLTLGYLSWRRRDKVETHERNERETQSGVRNVRPMGDPDH